ncbi:uncharacterized protein LOC124871734 isoform X3 [Girardinichthys multiradiatus]|uniref:uncharacterized protein LOC124871734 isoform X3 n=1 Tax=Girardinichthys multiradiatus TaxID=208333 RepID=UPI001FAC885C|nr:uncharacterized protein LOC124871734 isoform X3 [Girardinichthys multiradiatus]
MITIRQTMEEGVSEVLSSVVEDVSEAVSRNIDGAQLLHELLSAPWLHALLKIYECLLQFQRSTLSPLLPCASGLSLEIMAIIQRAHRPSAEACELYNLLSSPHVQAFLSSHDSVAQSDYLPLLPPLPDELPEDEEAMRIVCLVKNNQPLSGKGCGSVEDGVGVIHSRPKLECFVPTRKAWSGEELRMTENKAMPLPPLGNLPCHFLPWYKLTGSCHLCSQNTELWKQGLNHSAPAVLNPDTCSERPRPNKEDDASSRGSSDDYSYPPPPIPAYSVSLPNSPLVYKKGAPGTESRSIPTSDRAPVRVHTAPAILARQHSSWQQGVSTLPNPVRHRQKEPSKSSYILNPSVLHPNQPQQLQNTSQQHQHEHYQPPSAPGFNKTCSLGELRSTVHTVANSIEHSSQDARHLGQKMVAATEMITDHMEENVQALNLLAEVVDKLQGIVVTRNHSEASPPYRPKSNCHPTPPPRVSSLSPKVIHKPPTPSLWPHLHSPASSSSTSSSSSSAGSCADGFKGYHCPKGLHGGNKTSKHLEDADNYRHFQFNNGTVTRAQQEHKQDCNITGYLTTNKKRKKNKQPN